MLAVSSSFEHVLEAAFVAEMSLSVIFLVVALLQIYLRMPHRVGNSKHAHSYSVEQLDLAGYRSLPCSL